MPTLNGLSVLSADVVLPLMGAWHARCDVAHDATVTGLVSIDLDGLTLSGTVTRSGLNSGRLQLAVVGGRGGLSIEASAKHYTAPTVRQILADLTRVSGEVLSETIDSGLLGSTLTSWHRPEAPVSHCLTLLADELGVNWRILADGMLWLGAETWPTDSTEHTLLDERWTDGVFTVAMLPPTLRPGVTFRGQQIEQVTHWLASGQLRTEAQLTSPRGLLDRFLGPLRRRIDYSRAYPAKITKQNGDGTLQVLPDDNLIKGPGLDRVPIRRGLPGITDVQVTSGRCVLEFAAGDPSRPIVTAFEPGAVTLVEFDNGTKSIARVDDEVEVTIPANTFLVTAQAGVLNPTPVTVSGKINAGNDKLKG